MAKKSKAGLIVSAQILRSTSESQGAADMTHDSRASLFGTIVGVISDTHGLVRPEAIEVLQDVDLILHAGDVGSPEVLETLKHVAPVVAVCGNNDKGEWAEQLPDWEVVEVGPISIYILHNLNELDLNPAAAGFQVVVSGHSHKPSIERHRGVLYLNPGSAGPRRFRLPIALARLLVTGDTVDAEIIELSINDSNPNLDRNA